MALKPNPLDVHVGARIRLRRTLLRMSQEKLAAALGLTFQQVQKYERGANRVGASRLFQLATILNVPISFFFDDFHSTAHEPSAVGAREDDMRLFHEQDPLTKTEALELVRAYHRIPDPAMRRRVFELVMALGPSRTRGEGDT